MNTESGDLHALFSNQPVEQLTYEESYAELEQIVQALEANEQPLDQAMQLFERGQALARRCAVLLDAAELKIQQILGDELVDLNL